MVSETPQMSTTEKEQETEQSTKIGDVHPIGHILDDWAEWVSKDGEGELAVEYDEDDDVFNVTRNDRKAVLFTSDIDEAFYGEAQALFVESEIGEPPENLDLSQTLKFSGNELVLSRISLSDRHDKTILLVESATPLSKIDFQSFDLMVREVSTIARDLRKHLSSVLKVSDEDGEEEDFEDDDDEDEDDE